MVMEDMVDMDMEEAMEAMEAMEEVMEAMEAMEEVMEDMEVVMADMVTAIKKIQNETQNQ